MTAAESPRDVDLTRFAAFGFGLALASSTGQTFFIGLFGADLRASFGIDSAGFGLLYGLATLCSGGLMFWAGAQADRRPVRQVLVICLGLLCGGAVLMATAGTLAALGLALFLLRIGGQGLAGHLAMVVAARAPSRRGRCLAIASFGFIVGEALLPITVVALQGTLGMRGLWWLAAGVLALVFGPILWSLARFPVPRGAVAPRADPPRPLDRRALLARRPFQAALTVLMVPPFTVTALFLQQASIIEARQWTPALFAAGFLGFAASQAVSNWTTGALVDRYSARALFRFHLQPLVVGLAALAFVPGTAGLWIFFLGLGATAGAQAVVSSALWVELFGVAQVGLVRGVYFGFMVLSTAVSPFLLGSALEAGVSLSLLAGVLAAYAAVVPWIAVRGLGAPTPEQLPPN